MVKRGYHVSMALILSAALCAVALVAAEPLGVRAIRYEEVVRGGDEAVFFVSVINEGADEADDVRVQILSPDGLDIFEVAGADEIDSGEADSFLIPSYIAAGTPRGEYYLRFTVGDDEESRSVYRVITIV